MPVVTSTWSTTANTNWITSTGWVSSDPSFRLNQQLSSWVTGIGNTSIINIQATPNDATSRSGGDGVTWILQTRDGDTGSDWGIIFHPRRADTSGSFFANQWPQLGGRGGSYYNRTPGTSNNGYGSYTLLGNSSNESENLTVASNFFTAYETSGDTPWFVYSYENAAKTVRKIYAMFRLNTEDLSETSYYPQSGISKWIYLYASNDATSPIMAPIKDQGIPFKGMFDSGALTLRHATPRNTSTFGGFFFGVDGQYGDCHYLGKITTDFLVSNTFTGSWGDTITIQGSNYLCLGINGPSNIQTYWIKIS
jgi:hypothetical protein